MPTFFSSSEVVQLGVQIEKNGKDFYATVAELSKIEKAKKMFQYLAGEEEKHIKLFQNILSGIESYQPAEVYPPEYFAYLKALSEQHIFTKEKKGEEIAKKVKSDIHAIDLGIGFEKDSILFYYEIKKLVPQTGHPTIDKLIEQEQQHFKQLSELKLYGL